MDLSISEINAIIITPLESGKNENSVIYCKV